MLGGIVQRGEELDNVLIVDIDGELMGGTETEQFKNVIYNSIEEDIINIVVDLSKATWMNSSGLGMLITGLSTVRSSGGDLRLANLTERIKRPLQITKLDSVFAIYGSVEEAIASFK